MKPSNSSSPVFKLPVRVYIEDTDAGGVVFYANYLRFMERARTEYVRSLGFHRVMQLDAGLGYVVHSLSVQYRKPARLDDELWVSAQVIKLGKSFMLFRQTVCLAGSDEVMVEAEVKVACVDSVSLKPRRLEADLLSALEHQLQGKKQ